MKCKACKAEVRAINVQTPSVPAWFVVCQSPSCATQGLGRPLSDRSTTQAGAEDNYRNSQREQ